jgi:hypothetical protein
MQNLTTRSLVLKLLPLVVIVSLFVLPQVTHATNSAPVLDSSASPALQFVTENAPSPSGAVGTRVVTLADSDTYIGNVADSDSGALVGIAIVAANSTNGTWWYTTNGGTTWSALGAVSDSSARLLASDFSNSRLYFQPDFPFFGTISNGITFRAWDQTTGTNGGVADVSSNGGTTAFSSATDTASIVVNAGNSAPVLDATKTPVLGTVGENAGVPSGAVGSLIYTLLDFTTPAGGLDNVTDPDGGSQSGLAITAVDSGLTCYYSLNNGASWSAIGTPSNSSALLIGNDLNNRIYCRAGTDVTGTISAALTFRAWDQTGADGEGSFADTSTNGSGFAFSTATDTTDLVINATPTATNLSAAEVYTEDTSLNLVDIVASDVDSSVVTATLTLSNTAAGVLSIATSGAVTSIYNSLTGVWTAGGAKASVNTLLAGLTFVPTSNFNSSFTITTNVSDGYSAVTGTKAVAGVAVNDAPAATNLSAAESYTEDTALNLVDIVVSDIDSPNVTATLTLSSTSVGSLNSATSGAVTSVYIAGTGVWTASGAIASVNTLLAGLTFTPTANGNSNFTIATSISDGIAAALTGTKAVTGTAVNDAPVLDASKTPSFIDILEDASVPSGVVGTQVLSLVDLAPPSGGLDNVADVDSSPSLGIAIISVDTTNLTCYYTLNNGTTWNALGSVSSSSARLLAANGTNRIYCQPNANVSGTLASAITFRAWDQTSGSDGGTADVSTNGGTTAFSAASDTASLTVTAVNDAPVLDASRTPVMASITENASAPSGSVGSLVSSFVDAASPTGQVDNITDVDNSPSLGIAIISVDTTNLTCFYTTGGSWIALGAVSNTSARLLAANASNRIYCQPGLDFVGTVSSAITFRAWDQTSGSDGGTADVSTNGGTTAFSVASDTISITVNANVAPGATHLSDPEAYSLNTPLNLIDIAVSDSDNTTTTATLTLSNPLAGTLNTATSGSVTSTYNVLTGVWTASGAIAAVNALLAGLTFTPATDFFDTFTITTSVSDGLDSVSGSKSFTCSTTIPDEPTGLTAATVSASEIDLSWVAPVDDGGTAITGYKIERESPVGNGFSVLVPNTGVNSTTYSDTGLSASTQYNYRVSAVNTIGLGNSSDEAHATTAYGGAVILISNVQNSGGAPIINSSQPTENKTTNIATTFIFTKDLKKGMNDSDVAKLQEFLDTHGFPVATTGPGSRGQFTTKFGTQTFAALKRYQKSVGISSSGFLGPVTRAYVNAILTKGK